MKKVPLLILILFPLFMLSQKATINQDEQTVTLDKAKTIDVAKIIVNEARLKSFIDSLVIEIVSLQDRVEDVSEAVNDGLNKIKQLQSKNASLSNELIDLARQEAEVEKSLQKPSFYVYNSASGNLSGLNSINIGGGLQVGRSFFSLQVDPFIYEDLVYQIGVGFKLF